MNTDPVEAALEAACAAGDADAIRVYADFLEEHGVAGRAQLLALWHAWITKRASWPPSLKQDVVRMLRSLGGDHDPHWLDRIGFPFRVRPAESNMADVFGSAIAETLAARRRAT